MQHLSFLYRRRLLPSLFLFAVFSGCLKQRQLEVVDNAERWLRENTTLHGYWRPQGVVGCGSIDLGIGAKTFSSFKVKLTQKTDISPMSGPAQFGGDTTDKQHQRWGSLYTYLLGQTGQEAASALLNYKGGAYPQTAAHEWAKKMLTLANASSSSAEGNSLLSIEFFIQAELVEISSLHQASRQPNGTWVPTSSPQPEAHLLEVWKPQELVDKIESGLLSEESEEDPAFPGTYRFIRLGPATAICPKIAPYFYVSFKKQGS